MAQTDITIDLAVFDEAHRVAGSYEKKATALLDNQKIGISKRLFMTATPRILKNDQDAIIFAGMDDASQFGEVAYTLTFREAVDRKILVDYQLVVAAVTQDDLNTINATKSKKERIALAAIGSPGGICRWLQFGQRPFSPQYFVTVFLIPCGQKTHPYRNINTLASKVRVLFVHPTVSFLNFLLSRERDMDRV